MKRPHTRWIAAATAAAVIGAMAGAKWLGWVGLEPDVVDTVSADALAAALAPEPGLPLSAEDTDVVLVALCTLRADRLEPYGHSQPTSPFLRQLADRGVKMAHNFAQAPWTRPSMAALVTGLWPRAMRIDDLASGESFRRKIGDEHTLLAEHLQAAGYATVGVVTNPNLNAMFGFAQGFDAYDEPAGRYRDDPYRRSAAEAVDAALDMAASVPTSQRLYVRLNLTDTHKPRRYPRRYRALMDSSRADYDAAVRSTDAQLARLLVGLRESRPNILFVVAADHGEGLMLPRHHGPEHGNFVYRTTVETPLLWHHPALPEPGRSIEDLSMNIDVVPTVLDLLGLAPQRTLDGRSHAAALRNEAMEPRWPEVYSETFFRTVHASTVFDGAHQLIRTYPDRDERYVDALYRAADWQAEDDVAAEEAAITERLGGLLSTWESQQAARAAAAKAGNGGVPLDDGTRELLRELGYLE